MFSTISNEDLLKELRFKENIVGSKLLVRELKLSLRVEDDSYRPTIGIKVYLSDVSPTHPYEYTVSHYIHAAGKAEKYTPGTTIARSERAAIDLAVSNTLRIIEEAISEGHEANDSWLVVNKLF